MTMQMPKFALATVQDGRKRTNYIFQCSEIRNFNRVSCNDVRPNEVVDVKWQEPEGSFDGYYQAEIKCLTGKLLIIL